MSEQQQASGEILTRGDQSSVLAIPVEIIPAIYRESAKRGLERFQTMKVENAGEYAEMATLVNGLQKLDSTAERLALDAGRPFRDEGARCTKVGTDFRTPLADTRKKGLAMMKAWKDEDDARIAKEIREQQEAQLKEEEARRKAEAERKALEQLATAKEEQAAKKIETAVTPKQLEKAIALGEAAQEVRQKAVELEAKESLVPFASTAQISGPVKAKGVADKTVITFLQWDVAKLDTAFLLCDEKKLRKAILDGLVKPGAPGVIFTLGTKLKATGR